MNFSSMGGLATVSGVTLYAASKFAVRGLSLAADKDPRTRTFGAEKESRSRASCPMPCRRRW